MHDLHHDYPLASEKIEVTQDMWPKYIIPNLGNERKHKL